MVKLRVRVGGSYTDLDIANCNDETHPVEFDTPNFKGRAVVRIRDFVGITNDGSEPIHNSDYFDGRNRRFSFQIEGRFKREWDGQQVYFGTDFDRPIGLPDGFEMMLKLARYIDPIVQANLTKDGKPWILSPLVSSINTMAAWRPQDSKLPSPPPSPRPTMDLTRAFSVTENVSGAVSSAWGFLGRLKSGNRNTIMVVNNTTSNSNDNSRLPGYKTAHSASSDQVDKRGLSIGTTLRDSSTMTLPATPQPESVASSSASSADWKDATSEIDATAAIEEEEKKGGMPLGQWRQHIEEDTTFFLQGQPSLNTTQRRKYFQGEQNRKNFMYNTDLVYGFEFFSPHMDFNTGNIRMALSFNVLKYLNEQPVRYICRTLDGKTVFWAVQFEFVE